MEQGMTDFQFKALIEMVITILKKSESVDEAIQELETLINEKAH